MPHTAVEAQLAALDHERAGGRDVQRLRRQLPGIAHRRLGLRCRRRRRHDRLVRPVRVVIVPAQTDLVYSALQSALQSVNI